MTTPKLLLADDSVTIRKVVELTFADEGIQVTTAADAETAMQKFVEIQPDIVLVDVGLDGTNGYRICEMIKQDEATKHIPVLLLVGSFEPFDQDEAERVGADGFLTKPFQSIRDLVMRVFDLLASGVKDGSALAEPAPEAVSAETDDIENLYQKSFAETVEIEDFDTVDDLLDGAEMDDGMIETTFPTERYPDNFAEFIPAEEMAEQTKAFDWSPAAVISEKESGPLSESEVEPETREFEPKFVFEDTEEEETETDETLIPQEIEAGEAVSNNGEPQDISAELIDLIAQRVVDKLSDKVIREIAQTAVPEIAEKLIREALEEDKKQ